MTACEPKAYDGTRLTALRACVRLHALPARATLGGMNVATWNEVMLTKNVASVREERFRGNTGNEWLGDDVEALDAELAAILVDLEARAKYAKVEGAALPLLAHAKEVSEALQRRLANAAPRTLARFAPEVARLNGQLDTIERAFGELGSPVTLDGDSGRQPDR